ncbi:prenyltransferase [Thermoproteus uzoniensis 768-20]|uniref:heme o synthase n=2 Tax=Thermoproteus TaxID=2270 RepID=F2L075_THEU7|nr:prenyltransferase [Thermoproteus uzoniensis 768-20]
MKPRVIWLLVLASVAGYLYAGGRSPVSLAELVAVGTLSAGGAAAFNHYWERREDSVMSRTRARPIPAGCVEPRRALEFSLATTAVGIALALLWLGAPAAASVALGWFSYAVAYTVILKKRSIANIFVGGLAGVAAFITGCLSAGLLDASALLLSAAIYLWIPSHIWSLAYVYRQDYARAGIKMLPVVLDDRKASAVISALNIFSAAYMAATLLLVSPIAAAVQAAASAYGVYISARSLAGGDPGYFWRMFKASGPLLTVYLALIAAARL